MGRLFNIAKWAVTLGREPQDFLGAKWIRVVLNRVPKKNKRLWALRILSLSPHYFFDPENPKYAGLSHTEYLETVLASYVESRKAIYDAILSPYLNPGNTVVDYGCGPGFLSKLIAENTSRVYGCDISEGALACAEVLNSEQNLSFIRADKKGLSVIPNEGVDIVFSYALVQHLFDEILDLVLETCRQKLKRGGRIIVHVQLDDPEWKTEEEWRSDASIQGKLKLKYGLNCFARSAERYEDIVKEHGFDNVSVKPLSSFLEDDPADLSTQAILTATRL